jgi:hypothetical protein
MGETNLSQLRQCRRLDKPAFPAQPLERPFKRLHRCLLSREPTALDTPRTTTANAMAIRPASFALRRGGAMCRVFRIVAIWSSVDEAQTFMRDQLGPILAEGPVTPVEREEPDLESMYELHHVVRGS